jgi:hypothetical protein
MPEGAYVSTDFDGNARRMSGTDLADYLVSRAVEYPDSDVINQPVIEVERLAATTTTRACARVRSAMARAS